MIHDNTQPPAGTGAGELEDEPVGESVGPPVDRDAMVGIMRRYRATKRAREEAEANAVAYITQVKEEITQDLQNMKEREERIREAILVFISEHNAGAAFKVPGLGTAHKQKRTVTEIHDQELLVAHLEKREPEALADLYDRKISSSRAKELVRTRLQEDGEVLPGTETATKETLVVKFA